MKFLIFLLFVIAVATVKDINANPLISRNVAVPAQENEFPFIVALVFATATDAHHHYCCGTLISKKHILTAEHCLEDPRTGTPLHHIWDVRVIIGSNDMTRGRMLRITTWKTFTNWALENDIHDRRANDLYHDVAIATLSEEIHNIIPAAISQLKHKQIRGKDAVTASWSVDEHGGQSQFLQKAPLRVVTKNNSIAAMNGAPPSMAINHLFTIHKPSVFLGPGDSGAPLLHNGTLIGVNSAVCALSYDHSIKQNAHPSVKYYRKFIEAFTERTTD